MATSLEDQLLAARRAAGKLPWLPLLVILAAAAAAWPLLSEPGFLNTRGGGDSPFLLQRLHQLETALRDGHFPVRWMPDANYGFGYPFYNFYAPLSIYIAVLFRFLGSSYVHAIELAQLTGFVVAAWGIYLLALRWYKHQWAALLAAVAYTVAPFHMVNVYVRGDSLAEFWAMACYPWLILGADRLFDPRPEGFPFGRVVGLALPFAALVLSHNISALIFTPFLLLFLLLRWWAWSRGKSQTAVADHLRLLAPGLLAGLLALLLSAWFFVPALAEQELAQLGPVTEGYFRFDNHFRTVDLVQDSLLFDYSVAGGGAFSMGLVQAVAAALGALTLVVATWRQKVVAPAFSWFILLTLGLATFMITPGSRWLWEHLPLLSFTQFPWRFLSVQAFAAALAIGALAMLPFCRVVSLTTAVLLLISALAGLRTDQFLLPDSDVTAERLAQYEWFTGNIGSTVSAEYLPPTVKPRVYTSAWLNEDTRDAARVLEGELFAATVLQRRTQQQVWRLEAGPGGATVMLPLLSWPGWQAELDGDPLATWPANGAGLITMTLPSGVHEVILRLTRTPVRLAAELVSLVGLAVLLLLTFLGRRDLGLSRFTAVLLLGLVLLVFALRLWPTPLTAAEPATWDFAQMGYLHPDQGGVRFNNGVRLLRYEYDREQVNAGETVAVTVTFSGANGDELTVDLGSAARARPDNEPSPPVIAGQSQVLNQETLQFDLAVPNSAPAGLVIPRLTFAVGQPLLPSGQTRGDLFLRPLRVVSETAATDPGTLEVRATEVTQQTADSLDVHLIWLPAQQFSQNLKASLLLLGPDGDWLAQLDTQPGYGFLPSSEWRLSTAVNDWLSLPLPDEVSADSPLPLVARLYEVQSGEVQLTRRLGDVTWQDGEIRFAPNDPVFELPADLVPQSAVFDDSIRLQGYDLQRDGNLLSVTLVWEGLAPGIADATRFVHLFDPQTETIAMQVDSLPRNNSYPPSQWLPGEIVTDTVLLDLGAVPPGAYQIAVGWYRRDGTQFLRLTAMDSATETRYPQDRVVLPPLVER